MSAAAITELKQAADGLKRLGTGPFVRRVLTAVGPAEPVRTLMIDEGSRGTAEHRKGMMTTRGRCTP